MSKVLRSFLLFFCESHFRHLFLVCRKDRLGVTGCISYQNYSPKPSTLLLLVTMAITYHIVLILSSISTLARQDLANLLTYTPAGCKHMRNGGLWVRIMQRNWLRGKSVNFLINPLNSKYSYAG